MKMKIALMVLFAAGVATVLPAWTFPTQAEIKTAKREVGASAYVSHMLNKNRMGICEHVGAWGKSDFRITKFVGIAFGSDEFIQDGELGLELSYQAPNKRAPVFRRSYVDLQERLFGCRNISLSYSYKSKRLAGISMTRIENGTPEGYAAVTKTFFGMVDFMKKNYGMTFLSVSTNAYKGVDLPFLSARGSSMYTKIQIAMNLLGHGRGYDVQLLIRDAEYDNEQLEEGIDALRNPPTEQLKEWMKDAVIDERFLRKRKPVISAQEQERRIRITQDRINAVRDAVIARHEATGKFVRDLADLLQGERPLSGGKDSLYDAWGTELKYVRKGNRFFIASAGPDLEFGTADDISIESKE